MPDGTAAVIEIPVPEVRYREDLYPRMKTSPETVQKYAEDLDVLPPIVVNQHYELIDGWHRWTAHKKNEAQTIRAIVIETVSDSHLLELAIERNATHGLQLSQGDKKAMAIRIYLGSDPRERDGKKEQLAKILSVGERTVRAWLSRTDKDEKEARNQRIFEAWLACETQEAIAEREGLSQGEVSRSMPNGNLADLNRTDQAAAEHATDFDVPLYNVWKQQNKSEGSSHFGNSDPRWVDNLLYLYTKPFDVVVDPFAGGGSTIDVCKRRLRRYFVSDRKPIVEREKEIRAHDIVAGAGVVELPPLHKQLWKDVRIVYLDPPYWKQAEGQYSNDPTDLGNMDADTFHAVLANVITAFIKKMSGGGHVALILQPTQWKAPERQYTDHVAEMIARVKAPIAMRVQAPYESQQCNAQMVQWAKDNRQVLVLSREIVVWRVG